VGLTACAGLLGNTIHGGDEMGTSTRVTALLAGAAAAGVLIWFAGRFDGPTQHDYWISIGLIAAAGLVLGLVHMRWGADRGGGMLVALPVLAATIWVVLAAQPRAGGSVRTWSHDIGIGGVVRDLAVNVHVLSFGAALLVGTTAALVRRRVVATAPVAEPEPAAESAPRFATDPRGTYDTTDEPALKG
jgi:hypothetical protein